jgi:exoribonuclease R
LRVRVIQSANRAKDIQRRLDREIDRRVVRTLLSPDLTRPFGERPQRSGTVMGIAGSKVHVLLDDPPIDVSVLYREQGALLQGAWLEPSTDATRLVVRSTGKEICRLGDEVRVRAVAPESVVIV